uniref:GBD/FH3 domain-containing protein n=1 Tax=Oncorhynchus mykiss TaxID=8022 RepID=A0A8K9XHQ2_ONCMY
MLYVDGMNGVICHIETVQWLYALIGSKFRLVVKTALKLLLVFVEYSESNASLLIEAVTTVDTKRGTQWSNAMEILDEKDGVDTELLVYGMTLINKTLSALPDQDSFYDMVDGLEDQRMEAVAKRFLGRRGTDLDLMEQLNIYEVRHHTHMRTHTHTHTHTHTRYTHTHTHMHTHTHSDTQWHSFG